MASPGSRRKDETMDRKTYDRICWAADEGREKFIQNTITKESGRVIECTGNSFDVESRGERKYWPMEDCEPEERHRA